MTTGEHKPCHNRFFRCQMREKKAIVFIDKEGNSSPLLVPCPRVKFRAAGMELSVKKNAQLRRVTAGG